MKLLGTLIVTKVKIEKGSIDTRRSDRLYQHPLAYSTNSTVFSEDAQSPAVPLALSRIAQFL